MNLDKLTVNVRPLAGFEAMDLGLMMARRWFMSLWGLWWRRMLPVALLLGLLCVAMAVWQWDIAWAWLFIGLWWLKPLGEMPMVLFLSQKLFEQDFSSEQAWQQLSNLPKSDSISFLTHLRLGFRRQILLPIVLLERQPEQRRQRLQVLSQTQSNALIWQTMAFNLIESLLLVGFGVLAVQLLPQTLMEQLPVSDWLRHLPVWLEITTLALYLLVMSVVAVFFVASGFSAYICKRSVLEGWDIELKFRKLAQRHQALTNVQNVSVKGREHG